MKVYLIGNPLVPEDSLPLLLKTDLEKIFSQHEFIEADPNENFVPERNSLIIDTIIGLDEVRLFDSLDDFADHKLTSPHDYDLLFHLKLLIKLGKVKDIILLGLPLTQKRQQVLKVTRQQLVLLGLNPRIGKYNQSKYKS